MKTIIIRVKFLDWCKMKRYGNVEQFVISAALERLEDLHGAIPEALQFVESIYECPDTWMTSRCRSPSFVIPRHLAMYIMTFKLGMTNAAAGNVFNKDHSTVVNSKMLVFNSLRFNNPDITPYAKLIEKHYEKTR